MTNIEVALIVFIFTTIIEVSLLDRNCFIVEKKKTQKCDVISFDDGTVWHKVERVNND